MAVLEKIRRFCSAVATVKVAIMAYIHGSGLFQINISQSPHIHPTVQHIRDALQPSFLTGHGRHIVGDLLLHVVGATGIWRSIHGDVGRQYRDRCRRHRLLHHHSRRHHRHRTNGGGSRHGAANCRAKATTTGCADPTHATHTHSHTARRVGRTVHAAEMAWVAISDASRRHV